MANKVLYVSRGGNTEKLAKAIGKGAGVSAEAITSDTKAGKVDTLFIGGSIYAGKVDAKLRTFLQSLKKEDVKKVVVFSTAASKRTAKAEVKSILDVKGIKVSDNEFFCNGSFLLAYRNRPNEADLKEAEAFAKKEV